MQQLLGEKLRLQGDLEQAEPQERIKAFAEAEILEPRFDVLADVLHRPLGSIQTVFLDHHADQPGVTGLLQALQGEGLAQDRIGHRFGERGHDRSGPALGVKHLVPEWYGPHPVQRLVVQRGPRQGRRIVFAVSLRKLPTEGIAMF